MLERQGEVGPDDVGVDVVGIVFAHQSGRQIDADYLGGRGVDVLYQRGETACQRFVEAGTEQPIDNQRLGLQLRGVELLRHLDK